MFEAVVVHGSAALGMYMPMMRLSLFRGDMDVMVVPKVPDGWFVDFVKRLLTNCASLEAPRFSQRMIRGRLLILTVTARCGQIMDIVQVLACPPVATTTVMLPKFGQARCALACLRLGDLKQRLDMALSGVAQDDQGKFGLPDACSPDQNKAHVIKVGCRLVVMAASVALGAAVSSPTPWVLSEEAAFHEALGQGMKAQAFMKALADAGCLGRLPKNCSYEDMATLEGLVHLMDDMWRPFYMHSDDAQQPKSLLRVLVQTARALFEQLQGCRAHLEDVMGRQAKTRSELSAVRAENEVLTAEARLLRASFASAPVTDSADAVLGEEHEALRREHEALRREHEALRREHEALRKEHEALRKEHEVLLAANGTQASENDALRCEQSKVRGRRMGPFDTPALSLIFFVLIDYHPTDAHNGQVEPENDEDANAGKRNAEK
jgi:hypothetical protein